MSYRLFSLFDFRASLDMQKSDNITYLIVGID